MLLTYYLNSKKEKRKTLFKPCETNFLRNSKYVLKLQIFKSLLLHNE